MGLFKNEVGRPSNEIKSKRRRLIYLMIVLSFMLLGTISYTLFFSVKVGDSTATRLSLKPTTINAYFYYNGARSGDYKKMSCIAILGAKKCIILSPSITTNNGSTFLGWSTNQSAKSPSYRASSLTIISNNAKFYAVTKKTLTASFDYSNLDYIEYKSTSCTIYNQEKSCNITLPRYNKIGHLNEFWSTNKDVLNNLYGKSWKKEYFIEAGQNYSITNNVMLYPNFNNYHYDLYNNSGNKNQYKYRSISIYHSETIGKTLFEFEPGVTIDVVNTFISNMKTIYSKIPSLFIPAKVFVMNEKTYKDYSNYYGITRMTNRAAPSIDLKYDQNPSYGVVDTPSIDINSAIHELAHAFDAYYSFKEKTSLLSESTDFANFYNSIYHLIGEDNNKNKYSTLETFAGMFTNYYWQILGMDYRKQYYALKPKTRLTPEQENRLKIFMEKYINISKKW